ncbi:MAG: hypothetical protein A2X86_12095 [Bdellovibrionales bacterium GWA2_49_15]|nr:MAG: hypothetical protein A2X86_12095 [Bdellovibrionales bacterium GWA2_49_15]
MTLEYGSWWVLLLQVNHKRGAFWQNVTGSVEDDESFELGARRELLEETQLEAEYFFELDFECHFQNRRGQTVHEKSFLAAFRFPPNVIISDEHQNFNWKKIERVQKRDFGHASNYEAFVKATKMLDKID